MQTATLQNVQLTRQRDVNICGICVEAISSRFPSPRRIISSTNLLSLLKKWKLYPASLCSTVSAWKSNPTSKIRCLGKQSRIERIVDTPVLNCLRVLFQLLLESAFTDRSAPLAKILFRPMVNTFDTFIPCREQL